MTHKSRSDWEDSGNSRTRAKLKQMHRATIAFARFHIPTASFTHEEPSDGDILSYIQDQLVVVIRQGVRSISKYHCDIAILSSTICVTFTKKLWKVEPRSL